MARFPRTTRSTALRLAGAVAALAATVPAAGSQAATQGSGAKNPEFISCSGKAALVQDAIARWEKFPAPKFTAPLPVAGQLPQAVKQDVTSFAVDPRNENRVVVTNGDQIQVSNDAGCAWLPVVRVGDINLNPNQPPKADVTSTIKSVYISASHTIYALVEQFENGATVGQPHVLYSTSGNIGTWQNGDSGLPPLGHPLTLRASSRNPNVMYLSFSETREDSTTDPTCFPTPAGCLPNPGGGGGGGTASAGLLWGSRDGGRTWSARTDPQDLNGASVIKYYSVEDDDPSGNTLWAVANGLLRKSTNGGATFTVPAGVPQDGFTFTAVESIDHGDYPGPVQLIAFGTGRRMLRLTQGKWIPSTVQFANVESVAQLPDGEIVVATAPVNGYGAQVWRIFDRDFLDYEDENGVAYGALRQTYGWEQVTPHTALTQPPRASAGDGGRSHVGTFYVKTPRSVLRFLGSTLRNGDFDATGGTIDAPPPPRGRITPALLTLDLPLGKTKTVNYTLTLPPAPTPLDLDLLLDNSGSMEPLLTDLKQNLIQVLRTLNRAGVDVQVGVGQINVEPDPKSPPVDNPRTPDIDEGHPKPIYVRLRKIGPVNGQLFSALNKLDGNGGSGEEAQLESLWDSVTGDAWAPVGIPLLLGYEVPPGGDAGYRPGAIRIVVHATDEVLSQDITGGHNDFDEVIRKLKDAHVRQIGLSQDSPEAAIGLKRIAKGTGAVAPKGGVDCDGDGATDIKAGGALVCGTNYGLDTTLLNLLATISDRQTISLRTTSTPTFENITKSDFAIDAKKATVRTFKATFSCVNKTPGSYVNTITASLRNVDVAKAVATVNCGGVTTPVNPPPALGPTSPQPPPAPQPVVPAILPVNPLPQPQSQPQPQTQVNPQAGMADQEQEQLQVAAAENDITPGEDELAMSRVDSSRPWAAPGVTLAGMAMATAFATGGALRRRTRTATARATIH
jgi:hypothetical protein